MSVALGAAPLSDDGKIPLTKRLRDSYIIGRHPDGTPYDTMHEAADRIDKLQAQLARLQAMEKRAIMLRESNRMLPDSVFEYILEGDNRAAKAAADE